MGKPLAYPSRLLPEKPIITGTTNKIIAKSIIKEKVPPVMIVDFGDELTSR